MSKWTADAFVRQAHAVVAAFESVQQHEFRNTLHEWQLELQDPGFYCAGYPKGERVYLKHPPLTRQGSIAIDRSAGALSLEEELLEEKDVVFNDPNFCLTFENKENGEGDGATLLVATEWHFSIVYSETWQVPVLYFTVQQQQDGVLIPCNREQVVNLLMELQPSNRDWVDNNDSWDFVSFDEHPVTGIASCFLHPCQTSALMDTLRSGSIAVTGCENDNQQHQPPCLLLSWMSLILPAVGFGIPPSAYRKLLSILNNEHNESGDNTVDF